MFHLIYKAPVSVLLLLFFSCYILFSSNDSNAQVLNRVMGPIGGSGGSTSQPQDTGGDNTTLIIIGAAVIAGFLVYTLVLDKDKPKKIEKPDSTSQQSLLKHRINNGNNISALELKESQQLPINIYAGVQNQDVLIPERKVIIGIYCNF